MLVLAIGVTLLVHLYGGLSQSAPAMPAASEAAAVGLDGYDGHGPGSTADPHPPTHASPDHEHEAECGEIAPQAGGRVADACLPRSGLLFVVGFAPPLLGQLLTRQRLPRTPELITELGIQRV